MNVSVLMREFLICWLLPFIDTAMEERSTYFRKTSQTVLNVSYSNITAVSVIHCCSSCNSDELCRAVSYQRVTGQCSLSSDTAMVSQTQPSADWDVYRKHDDLRCEPDWFWFEGSCYAIVLRRPSRATAREYCMSMQAHLVIIETLEENNFLETKLKENKNVVFGDQIWTDGFWQGEWIWESTGNRVVFTDWDPTEPNPDEYYIAMSCWHEYNWNAANDKPENTFISICEK